jgi:hypothetical protein
MQTMLFHLAHFAAAPRAVLAFVFAAAAVAAVGLVALDAAPLREADVGADAAWVGHVDFDALRAADGAGKLWGAVPGKSALVARIEAEVGIDLRKHLSGATASGAGGKGSGAVVVRHGFSNEKLAAWLGKQRGFCAAGAGAGAAVGGGAVGGAGAPAAGAGGSHYFEFPQVGVGVLAADAAHLAAASARLGAEKSVAAFPQIYRELKTVRPVFIGFVNAAAVRSALQPAPPPAWALRVESAAVAASVEGAVLRVEVLAVLRDADAAAATAEMLRLFIHAQKPRFPSLETATVEVADGARLRLVVALPAVEIADGLRAGVSAK